MENKTCGECKYFVTSEYLDVCVVDGETRLATTTVPCDAFKPKVVTNGDKIRQMRNEDLADLLGCSCCSERNSDWCSHISCKQGKLAWLDAPAESEGEDE